MAVREAWRYAMRAMLWGHDIFGDFENSPDFMSREGAGEGKRGRGQYTTCSPFSTSMMWTLQPEGKPVLCATQP
eukprot:353939-Chlamydomonas_euryale.AAC.31